MELEKPYKKPVYGSWGPVGATLEAHSIRCKSDDAFIGFHQKSSLEFEFDSEKEVSLAFDCKRYTGGENVENSRGCVMQNKNLFNFGAQSPGVYRSVEKIKLIDK